MAERLTEDDVRPRYRADAVLRGEDVNADTALALASLGPFGSGNPRPRLLLVDTEIQQVDVTRTGSHLRCVVDTDGVRTRAIGFGMGDMAATLREDGHRRVLGVQLLVDEWQGALRPELRLERIGGARRSPAPSAACGPDCQQRESGGGGAREGVVERGVAGSDTPVRAPMRAGGRQGQPPSRSAALVLPIRSGRDLRGVGGRAAALAQVLATGEPTAILACSAAHALDDLRAALPLDDLTRNRLHCEGRGCAGIGGEGSHGSGVTLLEWDAALSRASLAEKTHVVAVDPPYRAEHAELLRALVEKGVMVHLYYGEEQRATTAKLLKYLVHPRFAMVCMYRALKAGSAEHEVGRAAADLAWQEGRVVLADDALARAAQVLAGLDLERANGGEARITVDAIPQYSEAEADYEECARLCRTL